jgi:chromosome segregation ATPase
MTPTRKLVEERTKTMPHKKTYSDPRTKAQISDENHKLLAKVSLLETDNQILTDGKTHAEANAKAIADKLVDLKGRYDAVSEELIKVRKGRDTAEGAASARRAQISKLEEEVRELRISSASAEAAYGELRGYQNGVEQLLKHIGGSTDGS